MSTKNQQHFRHNQDGFTIVEALISSLILFTLILGAGYATLKEVDYLKAELKGTVENNNALQKLIGIFADNTICQANFQGEPGNRNINDDNRALYIDQGRMAHFKTIYPDYEKFNFKLRDKIYFRSNKYIAYLDVVMKQKVHKSFSIPIYVEIDGTGRIQNCSSTVDDLLSVKIGGICNLENIGATRYVTFQERAQICNGSEWQNIETYAGSYMMSYQNGTEYCTHPNPYTGGCACPSGYNAQEGHFFPQNGDPNSGCSADDGISNYRFDPNTNDVVKATDPTQPCGFNMYVCVTAM